MNIAALHAHMRRLLHRIYLICAVSVSASACILIAMYLYIHRPTIVVQSFSQHIRSSYPDFSVYYEKNLNSSLQHANQVLQLPSTVLIEHRACGETNLFYNPIDTKIVVCDEFVEHVLQQQSPTDKSSQNYGQAYAQILFFLYHEIGHALIATGVVPVIENEESVADALSLWMLEHTAPANFDIQYVLYSPLFLPDSQLAVHDEHVSNSDRLYEIACVEYGLHPDLLQGSNIAIIEQRYLPQCADHSYFSQSSIEKSIYPLLQIR